MFFDFVVFGKQGKNAAIEFRLENGEINSIFIFFFKFLRYIFYYYKQITFFIFKYSSAITFYYFVV